MPWAERDVDTPIGPVTLVATEKGLAYLGTGGERPIRIAAWRERHLGDEPAVATLPALDEAEVQLHEYFRGERRVFEVALDVEGTPFQERVWAHLRAIPFGRTTTYSDIARQVGDASSVRAVGSANGANPIGIIVPCHRVIGADGALVGYAGGMRNKKKLLDHERACLGQTKLRFEA